MPMPTYAFRCDACRHEFTVDVPYSKKKDTRCPECDSAELTENFGSYRLNVVGGSGGGGAKGSGSDAEACSPFGGG